MLVLLESPLRGTFSRYLISLVFSPKLTSFFWIITNKQMFSFFLLQDCPKELSLSVDVYDEVGIGGGASGVSGGLLHPYSPKG